MPVIELKTYINASPELCFDLSLDIDLHMRSMEQANEKAISGRTNGLIQLGETVKWKAMHFRLNYVMTIKIVELIRPYHFTDEMIKGPFKQLPGRWPFWVQALEPYYSASQPSKQRELPYPSGHIQAGISANGPGALKICQVFWRPL
ncbi:MAG: hypothetical protein ABIY90_18855 [Puia sp.]